MSLPGSSHGFKFGERRTRPGGAGRGEMVLRWRQHVSAPVRASRCLHRCHPHPSPPPSKGEGKILRSEEHTSELQSLMRNSYAVFCLKKKTSPTQDTDTTAFDTHYTRSQQ